MKRFALLLFGAAGISCVVLALTGSRVLAVGGIVLLRLSASLFVPLQTEIQNRHVKAADRVTVLSIYAVLAEGTGIATNLLFGSGSGSSPGSHALRGCDVCAGGSIFPDLAQLGKIRWSAGGCALPAGMIY